MFERIVNLATLLLLVILVVQVAHVNRSLRRLEHEQRELLREHAHGPFVLLDHSHGPFLATPFLAIPRDLRPRRAGEPPNMSTDPEYWAFMQNLQRARTLACGEQGMAVVNTLRKKGIQATVQGVERDDLARPRVVISVGIFEPTRITRSLVNSLPKEIVGFPVVVERPHEDHCGFHALEARSL